MVETEIPWQVLYGPTDNAKALWEQEVMKEIFLTLEPQTAQIVILGYMNNDSRCIQLFENVSSILDIRKSTT